MVSTKNITKMYSGIVLKLLISACMLMMRVDAITWEHGIDLTEDFRMLWNIPNSDEIVVELQVRTLGYIGVGFSKDGKWGGADMVIGWVDQGQPFLQDRHVKRTGNSESEPVVDPSQDYELQLAYENATHTVLRFKRKFDTCDISYDVPITNDTIRILYIYHEEDPRRGSIEPGSLPSVQDATRGVRSLLLTQRESLQKPTLEPNIKILELRNQDVELPQKDDTLYWCKTFKLADLDQKHHVVKYEPVFDSTASVPYIQHITLYECQGATAELELASREPGRQCYRPNNPPISCNAIIATWARGSEGFTYPLEAGLALDPNQSRFFLMETHYSNMGNSDRIFTPQKADNSGLKFYYTPTLRKYDAGVMSVGIDPNWRHIIPPGQAHVVSEGQCVEECTKKAFPRQGINIFAVMMRTHMIGKEIRLRHIRGSEELMPISHDTNIDPYYQEFKRLRMPVRTMPGDRLISECTYDSSTRKLITLGGLTTREESCIVLTMYYPRQKRLTTCHSLPSLNTVLHSLGIEELAVNSNPVLITAPADLAGMTLESRLVSYDWENQFEHFQRVMRHGSFKAMCWDSRHTIVPGTEYIEGFSPNITKRWRKAPSQCAVASSGSSSSLGGPTTFANDFKNTVNDQQSNDEANEESNNIIEGAARSKVSRSSATETMGLSAATRLSDTIISPLLFLLLAILGAFKSLQRLNL